MKEGDGEITNASSPEPKTLRREERAEKGFPIHKEVSKILDPMFSLPEAH